MVEEKLLTVREVAHLLGVTEKDILDLAQNGSIPAYKLGGVYLRFKPEQVEEFKKHNKVDVPLSSQNAFADSVADFFYFNDFYILATILAALLIYMIFRV